MIKTKTFHVVPSVEEIQPKLDEALREIARDLEISEHVVSERVINIAFRKKLEGSTIEVWVIFYRTESMVTLR